MTNAYKFKETFGLYATELWARPEIEFLEWLNSEYKQQAEEKTRCKDCRYWKNQGTSVSWLPWMEVQTDENWFCADGARKED